MPTNETVMMDLLAQIKNLWMQAISTTTVKHYHMVHDIVLERLLKIREVSYLPHNGDASSNTNFRLEQSIRSPATKIVNCAGLHFQT